MKAHPAADLFPMLPPEELRALADDIKEHGQKLPIIVTPDDQLLDGRNRLEACRIAGVPPRIEAERGNPFAFVRSVNLKRRDLPGEVKGGIALRLAALEAASSAPGRTKGYQLEQVAKDSGVGLRTLERANRLEKADPELLDQVIAGKATMKQQERKIDKSERAAEDPDSKESDERYTTRAQFELCLRLAGVEKVLLDVAACDEAHVCSKYFTKANSGLDHDWNRFWWCNPPWSSIRPWVEHAFRQSSPGLMLLPAWTDRAWWQELIEPARDQAHSSIYTRFLPRAPFGSPGNPTAEGVEQPHFWCVLVSFFGPMPSRERVVDGQVLSRKTNKPARRTA
jgi:ParB-like chromosome segregation protein Spo0J